MRKTIVYISLLVTATLSAQNLSLTDALKLAKDDKYKQTELDVLKQEINLKIQKNKRLPLIYADANLQRNLIVPVTPVPAIAFNPDATPGEIIPLKFATDWNAKAGIQFSMDIFNAQNQSNIKLAENASKKSNLTKRQANDDFKYLIIDLYAQVYLAQQQFDLVLINEEKYKETLEILLKRYQAGRVSELEKNTAIQKALELEFTSSEAEYVFKNKLLDLSKYVDITPFDHFSTSIQELINSDPEVLSSDVDQLKIDIQRNELEISSNKQLALPKLTLNAFYGAQFYDNKLNIIQSDNWFGNSYVNVSLRIPITENYEKSLKAKQLAYELEISRSKLENLITEKRTFENKKSNDLLVLNKKIDNYNKIITLAEQNVQIAKKQVDLGTALVNTYNQELENLIANQKKLLQVNYDLLSKYLQKYLN